MLVSSLSPSRMDVSPVNMNFTRSLANTKYYFGSRSGGSIVDGYCCKYYEHPTLSVRSKSAHGAFLNGGASANNRSTTSTTTTSTTTTTANPNKKEISPRMLFKRLKVITRVALSVWKGKLRKREDSLPTTTATPPTATTTTTNSSTTANNNNNVIQQSANNLSNHLQQHLNNNQQQNHVQQQSQQQQQQTETELPPFLWVYHTNGNSTTASSQYTLYNNDQDSLVHNLQCEEPRECKGFRKNLRGKWRRLVKKKPQQEVYTIPAELRDQLKQIYVY